MKRAKKVEIPDPLDVKQFQKLQNHLRNSSMWYVSNSAKSEKELRQKFYDKGFPMGNVRVSKKDGTTEERNFIDEEIRFLKLAALLDDGSLAERLASRIVKSGRGKRVASQKLLQKGFKKEDIDAALNSIENEALDRAVERAGALAERSMPFRKAATIWDKKRVVYQKLTEKGFSSDDISQYIATREPEWG